MKCEKMKLLTRDVFRNGIFKRDSGKCIVPNCNKSAVDAHHIMERKLWKNEGYYIDNGTSVCEEHHMLAERDKILPITLRQYAGIKKKILPEQLDINNEYTKWGTGLESKDVRKYPTTYYFPFSPISENHIKDIGEVNNLTNCPIVITIKMDGSNVKLTRKYVAARNGLFADHKSFDYLKAIHSGIKDRIPENLNIYGEWLYAKHSIHYIEKLKLKNYLQIFAVYNTETNMWGSWSEVENVAKHVGLLTVPVIKHIKYERDFELVRELTKVGDDIINDGHEGIVARNIFPIHNSKFNENVMKFVRVNHVQTDKHWANNPIIKNEEE